MPQTFVCKGCGAVLCTLTDQMLMPKEVLWRFGDECPKCGRKLNPNPDLSQDITIELMKGAKPVYNLWKKRLLWERG